jgi:outer membrane lipoprotein-sorting protein
MVERVTVVAGATRRRWLSVAVAALALAALPAAIAARPVRAAPVSPNDLVARIRQSNAQAFSGYVVSTGTAGLPSLPQLADVADLFNGDTRMRVWHAAPTHWRVDVIDTGAERDTYQVADQQVIWDYGLNQITVVAGALPVRLPRGADLTPPELARRLLATASTANLSSLPAQRVAGVTAAGVRLTPRSAQTTVGTIDVWADPRTGLPVQVTVTGRGATLPVLTTRFADLALTPPSPAELTPPAARAGMSVTAADPDQVSGALRSVATGPLPDALAGQARDDTSIVTASGVGVYGTGLTQLVVIPVPRRTGLDAIRQATKGGGAAATFGRAQGVVLSTPLLSVLVLSSNRRSFLVAGLVPRSVLTQAGQDLANYRPVRR